MQTPEKEFYESKTWGLLTSVDLFGCNPQTIRNAEAIKRYVRELCQLIDMKLFGETQVVHFGQEEKVAGYSMVQLIETSLISAHFTNKNNNAYVDVFSCKYYDPSAVAEFTKKFFEAKEIKMHYLLRGEGKA